MQFIEVNKSISKEDLVTPVKNYISECLSKNTKINYACSWKSFTKWCADRNVASLPSTPEIVSAFFADHADNGFSPPTIVHRCAAIKKAHEFAGYDSPTASILVKKTVAGIKRTIKHSPDRKAPATAERIEQMISHCDNSVIGLRDKALLLIGFLGAFRRSELIALTVNDIEQTAEGIKIIIRQSKTDQEGKGQTIAILNGINFRAVDALMHWLKIANITDGYLFRSIRKGGNVQKEGLSSQSIANIIKHYAKKSGFTVDQFSGHSLRAGFLTSAAEAGASIFKMTEISRHKDIQTVMGYVRSAKIFENHASDKFA